MDRFSRTPARGSVYGRSSSLTKGKKVSFDKPRSSSYEGRPSSAFLGVGRVGSSAAPQAKKKLEFDKKTIVSMRKRLAEALSGLGHDVLDSDLVGPSDKVFWTMYDFLLKHIFPDFKLNPAKKEDTIFQHMEMLQYPHVIQKSSLKCIGVPHTWPHVMAFLIYITQIIQFGTQCEEVYEDGEERHDGSPAASNQMTDVADQIIELENEFYMREHLVQMASPNDEDDDEDDGACEEALEQNVKMFKEDMVKVILAGMDRGELEEHIEKLEGEVEALSNKPDEVKQLTEKDARVMGDISELQQGIRSANNEQLLVRDDVKTLRGQLDRIALERDQLEEEKKRFIEVIQNQGYSREEVRRLKTARLEKKKELKNMNAKLVTLDEDLSKREHEISNVLDEILNNESVYSKLARDLGLTPSSAPLAKGRDFTMDISDKDNSTRLRQLQAEIEKMFGDHKRACDELRGQLAEYDKEIKEVQIRRKEEREVGLRLTERKNELQERNDSQQQVLQDKLDQLKDEHNDLALRLENDLKMIEEVNLAEHGVETLKERLKQQTEEYSAKLEEAEQLKRDVFQEAMACKAKNDALVTGLITRTEERRRQRNVEIETWKKKFKNIDSVKASIQGMLDNGREAGRKMDEEIAKVEQTLGDMKDYLNNVEKNLK